MDSVAAIIAAGIAWWVAWIIIAPLRATHRGIASAVMVAVPLLGLGLYLYLGQAFLNDAPLAPRLAGAPETLPTGAVVVRLEQSLRATPDDEKGWRLLARLRHNMGAYDKAAIAWRRVLALRADAEAYTGLAQAMIESEAGIISDAVVDLLDAALRDDPQNLRARFWRGMAWQQSGAQEKAREIWQALYDELPPETPLAQALAQALAQHLRSDTP